MCPWTNVANEVLEGKERLHRRQGSRSVHTQRLRCERCASGGDGRALRGRGGAHSGPKWKQLEKLLSLVLAILKSFDIVYHRKKHAYATSSTSGSTAAVNSIREAHDVYLAALEALALCFDVQLNERLRRVQIAYERRCVHLEEIARPIDDLDSEKLRAGALAEAQIQSKSSVAKSIRGSVANIGKSLFGGVEGIRRRTSDNQIPVPRNPDSSADPPSHDLLLSSKPPARSSFSRQHAPTLATVEIVAAATSLLSSMMKA